MLSKWPVEKIGLHAEVYSGFAFKSSDLNDTCGIPVVKIKNVNNKIVDVAEVQYFPDELVSGKHQKFFLEDGDVLIAMTGQGSVGRVGRLSLDDGEKVLLNQRVGKFIPKPSLDLHYLYYVSSTDYYEKVFFNAGLGSGQPNLSPDVICNVELPIPPLEIQKHIALVLGTLDKKIELNRKQNRTLEAIAQALFKRWFVEFEFPDENGQPYQSSGGAMQPSELGEIPAGWEVAPLSGVATYLSRGLTPAYVENDGVVVLNQKCIRDGWINTTPARRHDPQARKIGGRELQPGDVLVNSTGVGTLGRVAQAVSLDEATVVDSHVTVVRADTSQVSPEYLGVCLRLKEREIEYMAEGSTGQTELSRVKLGEMPVVVPDERILGLFTEVVGGLNAKRTLNWKKSDTLSRTRDTLLPKIMSGELRVEDVA